MAALIVAIFATFISYGIATQVLGWEPSLVLWAIAAANIGACCCLPITLLGERVPWFKRHVIPDMLRTWIFFAGLFFAVFLGMLREIRDLRTFLWMVLPLIGTTGYMIWIYGPVHDQLIRRSQLRARARARRERTASG